LPESFGALAVALADVLGVAGDLDAVNAAGGALALGDPNATSGLRAVVTLAHRLRRADGATGLAVAAGLGDGAAVVLRRPGGITSV
jgi:acetyl-CoA acetyltransferase